MRKRTLIVLTAILLVVVGIIMFIYGTLSVYYFEVGTEFGWRISIYWRMVTMLGLGLIILTYDGIEKKLFDKGNRKALSPREKRVLRFGTITVYSLIVLIVLLTTLWILKIFAYSFSMVLLILYYSLILFYFLWVQYVTFLLGVGYYGGGPADADISDEKN
jgi:hypothetical protein